MAIENTEEVITAASKKKQSSNKLIVVEACNDDNSVVNLSLAKMKELDLSAGDPVLLKGKRRRNTVCVVLKHDSVPNDRISMNRCVRYNLRVKIGDVVSIQRCDDIKCAKQVHILPIDDTVWGLTGHLFDVYLKPYFHRAYRPIHKGDIFRVRKGMRYVEFKVVDTDPSPYCIVTPETVINCEGDPIKREEEEDRNGVGYDGVGGCGEQLAQIKEIVELPLRHPSLFSVIGAKPQSGILLYGPHGVGKTLIARAIAHETEAFFFLINGNEMMSSQVGESERYLREVFEEAEKRAPSIIFIDDLDAFAPKREATYGDAQRRIVSQLMTLMDGFKQRSRVIVMATTNQPNSVDAALRRFGRFDREIHIHIPDYMGRLEILRIHTQNMFLSEDVDICKIAAETRGLVGSELASICHEAAMHQILEKTFHIDLNDEEIDADVLNSLAVTMDNFQKAIGNRAVGQEKVDTFPSLTVKTQTGDFEAIKNKPQKTVPMSTENSSIIQETLDAVPNVTFNVTDRPELVKKELQKIIPKSVESRSQKTIHAVPNVTLKNTDKPPPIKKELRKVIPETNNQTGVGYDGVGGCWEQLAQIKEIVELPLRHPSLFSAIGAKPHSGILLHGPHGVGKTLIAKAIAYETEAFFILINGNEMMCLQAGEAERYLREVFEEAEKRAPSIIFIDDLDTIAPKREGIYADVQRRIVSQLITLMDGFKQRSRVIVMATTNQPNSIDAALRRFGRFDREIHIHIPDYMGRLEILRIHTQNMLLSEDVDICKIAAETRGLVGSELASICHESAMHQIREKTFHIDLNDEEIDGDVLNSLAVTMDNFQKAIGNRAVAQEKVDTFPSLTVRTQTADFKAIKNKPQKTVPMYKEIQEMVDAVPNVSFNVTDRPKLVKKELQKIIPRSVESRSQKTVHAVPNVTFKNTDKPPPIKKELRKVIPAVVFYTFG